MVLKPESKPVIQKKQVTIDDVIRNGTDALKHIITTQEEILFDDYKIGGNGREMVDYNCEKILRHAQEIYGVSNNNYRIIGYLMAVNKAGYTTLLTTMLDEEQQKSEERLENITIPELNKAQIDAFCKETYKGLLKPIDTPLELLRRI